jgi:prefoldin subunit 5
MSNKDLPSIDDFAEDLDSLPSVDKFITEEVQEDLPSVEDFIEKEQEIIAEQTITIEDANGETFAEVQDIVPPWPELVKMVNDIRADIPDIPEIKYYDKELEQLAEQISQVRGEIPEVPEVRYYEREVEAICEQIDLVRSEIKDLPEVKYYDEQVDQIEDRIDTLQTEVTNLPEVKYYDAEISAICEAIDAVKASIPTFPKWVNEVNEVPDFSWIGKTFSVIDDDFIKVNDTIDALKEHVKLDIKNLVEENEVKHFENRVQFGTEVKDLDTKLGEEKDKIWKELRSSSMKIWEYHKEFKDDDRKLKKQILGEYNNLKTQIEERLVKYNVDNVKTDELLLNYFNELKEEVSSIVVPEVKYYDDDIKGVKTELKELKNLVKLIKSEQKEIQEGLLNEPTDEKQSVDGQSDPLTPLDQQFPNLKALADHYRLFITRTQQQLAVMGGGGEVRLEFLDDLDRDSALVDGKFLKYQASTKTFVGADASGESTKTLDSVLGDGNSSTKGMSVGVLTATNAFITGDLNVTGDLVYDEVTGRNINITGVGTVTKLHVGVATDATEDLVVTGDARVTGILTVGTGSVTINGNTNDISGVGVITATSLVGNLTGNVTGNATGLSGSPDITVTNVNAGIISATSLVGNVTGNVTGNATGLTGSPDIALTNITAGIITASSALYLPQYTTSARDAATFAAGAIIFNTTTKKINFYDGTNFVELPGVTLGLGMGVF